MKPTSFATRMVAMLFFAITLFLFSHNAHAQVPPPFVLKWGSFGTADGQFNNPVGIGADSLGNVYVADVGNNRIQKFDADGTHLLTWGSVGTGTGQFGAGGLRGLAVGPGDVIYVVDSANVRVQVFNTNGVYQREFSLNPGGLPGGRFTNGIAVDSNSGDVYVAVGGGNVCPCDGRNYWVRKYDNAGTFLLEWGNNGPSTAQGKFTRPFAIAVDQSGNVYVLESFAARMQVFNSSGVFQRVINSAASGDGFFFDATGLTVDNSGNVYIADRAGQRIQKFDPAGNFVTKWGSPGAGNGQFNRPDWITVTPGGIFYVADGLNNRIQKFGSTNNPPTANAGPDQAVRLGTTVNLDGSASFDDNTASAALDHAWAFQSKPAGSTAVLTGAATATPSFTVDITGTYLVELIVTDEGGLVSTADVVQIGSDNLAPTADAGDDQLVIVSNPVNLNGLGSSDPETDPITYAWTITSSPVGSTAMLFGNNSQDPSFTPDLEGTYVVSLVVSDDIGPGVADTVVITATTAEGFAESQIVSADALISALDKNQVTKKGNKKKLRKLLAKATVKIQKGKPDKAIKKLNKAIVRTDGCVLRGTPDVKNKSKPKPKPKIKRDWITDCTAQTDVYTILTAALTALMS